MIFFLFGEDAFRSHEKLLAMKTRFFEKNPRSTGFFEFDFSEGASVKEFSVTIGQGGLFSEKKCVFAKRPFSAPIETRRELAEWIDREGEVLANDSDRVLVLWEPGSVKKNEKLWKALSGKSVRKEECALLAPREVERWIELRTKEAGAIGIHQEARRRLIDRFSANTALLNTEIQKLGTYRFGEMITIDDVATLSSDVRAEENAFAAIDALFSGKKKEALRGFSKLIEQEDPIKLLGACSWQLRNTLRVKSARESGAARTPGEVAKLLALHPFTAQKMFQMAMLLSEKQLIRSFSLLASLDREVKKGERDPRLAILKFVSRF